MPERDHFAIKTFEKSKGTYGKGRMKAALNRCGHEIGMYAIRPLMRRHGLKVVPKCRSKRTTDSRHNLPMAENLL